jgi:hypothetical protein
MGTWTQRSVCIDELSYQADGSIIPVQQTIEGVDKVIVDQPFKVSLLKNSVKLSEGKSLVFSNTPLGTGYYYFSVEVEDVTSTFMLQIKTKQGALLCTVPVSHNGIIEVGLNHAKGVQDIVINPVGTTKGAVLKSASFFAGSPFK